MEEILKMPWTQRIQHLQCRSVLELGTGQGVSGAQIMAGLPVASCFITINYAYPVDYVFGEYLLPWKVDPRLKMLIADTLDIATLGMVPYGVDLMFIDSTHEAWVAATELLRFQQKLTDKALVIVDDLNQHDMVDFWDSLPYEKARVVNQGIFRYDTKLPYTAEFPRGMTSKEQAENDVRACKSYPI